MKRLMLIGLALMVALISFSVTIAQDDDMNTTGPHVFEITVYNVIDLEGWNEAGLALEVLMDGVEGYVGSLDYMTFFSLAPEMAEGQMYAVSISEWESVAAYEAIDELMDDPAVMAYLDTINIIADVVVEPFVIGEEISLEDFPQAGEVFEVAIRDLSAYEDPVDFLRVIRGFTDVLGEEEGVLREYEWLSVNGQYFVGMTRYASMEAFQAASQSEAVFAFPATGRVFAEYPPMVAQITTLIED